MIKHKWYLFPDTAHSDIASICVFNYKNGLYPFYDSRKSHPKPEVSIKNFWKISSLTPSPKLQALDAVSLDDELNT